MIDGELFIPILEALMNNEELPDLPEEYHKCVLGEKPRLSIFVDLDELGMKIYEAGINPYGCLLYTSRCV